jgi:zinc transport system substrate-binding protein
MRRILLLSILIALISCQQEVKRPDRPVIAVSIVPQKYLISSIVDTLADVVVMVPPGASPATWEATPAQMKQLSFATAYFRIGHIGFEKAWMEKIKELNDSMQIIDLSAGLELIKADYKHGDHSHTGVDPHVWMSPASMEDMARKTYYELKGLFPEHKETLRKNYEVLLGEIKLTRRFVDEQLSKHGGKAFLIFHPSLGYLARDYYLKQVSIEFEGKEPSASHMAEIIEQARERGIKSIFVQAEFDERNASIVAEEIGGSIIRINPLSENWADEMKSIARKLNNALK